MKDKINALDYIINNTRNIDTRKIVLKIMDKVNVNNKNHSNISQINRNLRPFLKLLSSPVEREEMHPNIQLGKASTHEIKDYILEKLFYDKLNTQYLCFNDIEWMIDKRNGDCDTSRVVWYIDKISNYAHRTVVNVNKIKIENRNIIPILKLKTFNIFKLNDCTNPYFIIKHSFKEHNDEKLFSSSKLTYIDPIDRNKYQIISAYIDVTIIYANINIPLSGEVSNLSNEKEIMKWISRKIAFLKFLDVLNTSKRLTHNSIINFELNDWISEYKNTCSTKDRNRNKIILG